MTVRRRGEQVRALLRTIYYAVIIGVGVDAFFFAWLLAEDRFGLARMDAQLTAVGAAGTATIITWVVAATVRSVWRKRVAARHPAKPVPAALAAPVPAAPVPAGFAEPVDEPAAPRLAPVVASSPLASPAARVRAEDMAALDRAEPNTEASAAGASATNPEEADDERQTSELEVVADQPKPALARPEPPARPFVPTPHLPEPGEAHPAGEEMVDSVAASRANVAEAVRLYGADDARTLRSKAVLACAYWAAGELDRAIPLFEETVDSAGRMLGEDHLETLTWRSDLAAAYELDGRLDDAIEVYETALAGRERVLGANHPDTQLVRSNLAVATAVRANLTRGRGLAAE